MNTIPHKCLIDLGFMIIEDDAAGLIAVAEIENDTVCYLIYHGQLRTYNKGILAKDVTTIESLKKVMVENNINIKP